MAFAGHCGLEVELEAADTQRALGELFAEELGVVLQIEASRETEVMAVLREAGLDRFSRIVARVTEEDSIGFRGGSGELLRATRSELRAIWSETSFRMQSLRDNPDCAAEERARSVDPSDPGLFARLLFDPAQDVAAPYLSAGARPSVAILREQGVNSHSEMAAAFDRAGFEPLDVHMTDLIAGRVSLDRFNGLVACGGFSYGDVLGAGEGWAKSILFNNVLRERFTEFFARSDSFSLGVCNGCQMMSALKDLIPGTAHWPRFVRNRSEQFEGRVALVEVLPTPSVFFTGMSGSILPIAVAHGEGRAEFADPAAAARCVGSGLVSLRYVDNTGVPTESYPANPNGSPFGITGLTSDDGRATILMPHPERVFRTVQNSWYPREWGEDGGWLRMFRNARAWLG
jgi:phosphoribosylformylglycinamidine synthase